MSLPAVSRHLKVLTEAGLIERSTEAQWRRCALRGEGMRAAADWIEFYRRFWEQQFDQLDAFLARTAPKHAAAPKPARRSAVAAVLDDNTLRSSACSTRRANACSTPGPTQEQFIQWMCPPGVMSMRCELDVRPGGAWRSRGRVPTGTSRRRARYLEVDAARAAGLHLGAS